MSSEEEQKHMRRLFRENGPEVRDSELLPALRERLSGRDARAFRSRRFRTMAVATAAFLVLAVAAVGAYEVIVHIGNKTSVVVFTDDPMGASTTATSSLAGSPESPATVTTLPATGVQIVPTGSLFGLDVRQPFIDHDATEALGDDAHKIVTTWVAVGNRREIPLPFKLSDLTVIDAYDELAYQLGDQGIEREQYMFSETVTPLWKPALVDQEIAPGDVVGGYVSWKVPWYVWPQMVLYTFPGPERGGSGQGWKMPIFSDLNAGNRFYLPVGKLLHRGVVDGPKEEPFRPEDPVTVAEFAKMIVIAAAPYNKATFSYPDGYISEARKAGLAAWGERTSSEALTRLEVALSIARLAKETLGSPPADYELPFADVLESAERELALLAYNGVVSGSTATRFNPEADCSRGQACRMLALVLDSRFRKEESMIPASLREGMTTTTTSIG